MSKNPHYHGHRLRLKERLRTEPGALADYEVLELLLSYARPRCDTKPTAKALLARFGGLSGVLRAGEEDLLDVEGLGEAQTLFLQLIREFLARMEEEPVRRREVLSSPNKVADLARARFGSSRTEQMWVALVDNKNRLMSWKQISQGTVSEAPVYPREVLALALRSQAGGVILVHNHPGGDPSPSGQDMEITRRIARSGLELDVRVLDHIIITEDSFFSFQERGLL
jgi:DNA repair protein RadC